MKFNALFPQIPLTLIRNESGLYLYQHALTDRLTIKSPIENPQGSEFKIMIGEETGTYRNGSKYIRKVKIVLFPPEAGLPKLDLQISQAKGVLRFDRCEIAYAIDLGDRHYLKIEAY